MPITQGSHRGLFGQFVRFLGILVAVLCRPFTQIPLHLELLSG